MYLVGHVRCRHLGGTHVVDAVPTDAAEVVSPAVLPRGSRELGSRRGERSPPSPLAALDHHVAAASKDRSPGAEGGGADGWLTAAPTSAGALDQAARARGAWAACSWCRAQK